MKRIILFSIIALLIGAGIFSFFHEDKEITNNNWEVHEDFDLGFSISFPKNWTYSWEQGEAKTSFLLKNSLDHNASIMSIHFWKAYGPAVQIYLDSPYFNDNLSEVHPMAERYYDEYVIINGIQREARRGVEPDGGYENRTMDYWRYFFDEGNSLFVTNPPVVYSGSARWLEEVDSIISTFTWFGSDPEWRANKMLWDLPEIIQETQRIESDFDGIKAFSRIENQIDNNTYEFYFGSSHPNGHTSRIWTFRINVFTEEILVYNLVADEWLTIQEWRDNDYSFGY